MRSVACLIIAASLAVAEDPMPKTTQSGVGTGVKDSNVDFVDSMSDYYRLSRRAVLAIRDKGIMDEEVPAVLHITKKSNASANQVLDAKKAGKSWEEIAKAHNVAVQSGTLVEDANLDFLSNYHGVAPADVKALRAKGASWISINQEYRRVGATPPARK